MKRLTFWFGIATLMYSLVGFSMEVNKHQNSLSEKAVSFKIKVYGEGDMWVFQCESGCAWKELKLHDGMVRFNSPAMFLNEKGSLRFRKRNLDQMKSQADFLLELRRTGRGVKIINHKGADWDHQQFECIVGDCELEFTNVN